MCYVQNTYTLAVIVIPAYMRAYKNLPKTHRLLDFGLFNLGVYHPSLCVDLVVHACPRGHI